jgi:hypothetical protein
MNAARLAGELSLREELTQAVERNALLHSHPAAAAHPDRARAIAETQARIDELVAHLDSTLS